MSIYVTYLTLPCGDKPLNDINFIKNQNPQKLILAVPVAPEDAYKEIKKLVDEVICLYSTDKFFAISQFYDEFAQLGDGEVRKYLNEKTK